MDEQTAAQLRAPFPAEKVGKLPKVTCGDCSAKDRKCEKHTKKTCKICKAWVSTSHTHLDFVGHADVTDRLLKVDPEWNWEPLSLTDLGLPAMDGNNGMWIKLTVGGVTRLGYGDAGAKRGANAVKETIGDAIRNAAMRFGVALDMWMKDAPAPVIEEVPERQVERPEQTPRQRCNEIRGQIRSVGRTKGMDIAQIGDEYAAWSRGGQILSEENPDSLLAFLNSLRDDYEAEK